MKVTWNVSPVGYQLISKRCPACHGQQDFTPSGAFRVNSQKNARCLEYLSVRPLRVYLEHQPVLSFTGQQNQSAALRAI